jgi:hypothetical protein
MSRAAGERSLVERYMGRGFDEPVIVEPDRVNPGLLGVAEYVKPSVGLQLLRQEILGEKVFDDGFREYTRRWAFKHPTPYDFFRTIEDTSGRRLDWFWRGWFLENARYDQAIDTVVVRAAGDTAVVGVSYGNRERGVLPLRVRFTLRDARCSGAECPTTTEDFEYPAEVWSTNTARYSRRYTFPRQDGGRGPDRSGRPAGGRRPGQQRLDGPARGRPGRAALIPPRSGDS